MYFSEYIEGLCRMHKDIGHSEKECHYSDLNEDAQNAYSHLRMHYPCVVLDEGDAEFGGSESQTYQTDSYLLLFLDHVRDTGDAAEVRSAFRRMKGIALDFLKRMRRDRRRLPLLNRFEVVGVELYRVYLQDAGLYGYAMQVQVTGLFVDLDCNETFADNE
ncbi:MAG: hypothetical protein IJ901_10595 [Bacteroidaceae bacterium]|nr:hypothetical protein [Bacteroidaceae bacterium]